jgi:hypothetical protein
MEVFAVFTRGMDFYDRDELDKVFSDCITAEAYAAEQRLIVDEDALNEGDLLYSEVSVEKWNVH